MQSKDELNDKMDFDAGYIALKSLEGYDQVDARLPFPNTMPGLKRAYFEEKKDGSVRYGGLKALTIKPQELDSLQGILVPLPQERMEAAFTLSRNGLGSQKI